MSLRDGEGAEFVALLQQPIHGRLRGWGSDPHHLIRVMSAKGARPAGSLPAQMPESGRDG